MVKLTSLLACAANMTSDPRQAMETSLNLICAQTGWALGQLVMFDFESIALRPVLRVWHHASESDYTPLVDASKDLVFSGLRGHFLARVIAEKRPVWIPDLRRCRDFSRRRVALDCELRSAFAFPVIVLGRVAAVLEFWGARPRRVNAAVVSAMTALAGQLARLVERQRAAVRRGELVDIIDAIDTALITRDLSGTITSWNRGAERMLGYDAGETLGRPITFLGLPQSNTRLGANNAAIMSGGIVAPYASYCRARDGKRVDVLISLSPMRDAGGSVSGAAIVMQDISALVEARTSARQSEEQCRATFDHAAVGIAHIAPDGRWLRVNLALAHMLGYPIEEVLRRTPADLTHPRDRAVERRYVERVLRGDIDHYSIEKRFQRKDGHPVWAHVTAALVRNGAGDPDYFVSVVQDVTARKDAERAVRDVERTRETLLANLPGMAYRREHSRRGTLEFVSDGCRALTGYDANELLTQVVYRDLIHPEDRPAVLRRLRRALCKGDRFELEYRISCRDGTQKHVWERGQRVVQGRRAFLEGYVTDVTARVVASQALSSSRMQLELIADNVPAMIAYFDRGYRYLYANRGYREFFSEGQAIAGRTLQQVLGADGWQEIETYAARALKGEPTSYERTALGPDAETRQLSVSMLPCRDEAGAVLGVHAFVLDVTDRARHEQALRYTANHDALTDLPNRTLLGDRLSQTLGIAQRQGSMAAVLFADIDRFKRVNDSLGHHIGDDLIRTISRRFSAVIRAGDTVARVGGDEFAFVLPDLKSEEDALQVADKIRRVVSTPVNLGGQDMVVSASVGVAVYPRDGADPAALLRNADAALYRAKDQGRDCIRFFTPEMNERLVSQLQLERELRCAMERREFFLEYQPIVSMKTGALLGAEALIRWKKSDGSRVSPAEFIPIAEETGLIVPIGQWVLETAAREAATWSRPHGMPLFVSVNLSMKQFKDLGLASNVRDVLEGTSLPARQLKLEITESTVMQDAESAIATLTELKALGLALSVDDFGTGYSSLSYLKRFPLDTLKIDRSFVRDLPADEEDRVICRSVIDLAHALGLGVVAEGIESVDQADALRRMGCDMAQGFFFNRPLPRESFRALLTGAA